jgi:hypothetical protein
MKKQTMEWDRLFYDGVPQLIGDDGNVIIESGWDVTDGKPHELWVRIKKEFPNATGYRDFCRAYREGEEDFKSYCEREQRRYDYFWGKHEKIF